MRLDQAVEVAVLERGGTVESRHLGLGVLVDTDGRVLDAIGDPEAIVFPRSALKPVQATAVRGTGLQLEGVRLALASASHSGSAAHVAVVEGMLHDAGLTDDALRCPAWWPSDAQARSAESAPRRITMTCSGKHAGFLAGSVAAGWSTDDYLSPDHRVQRAVASTVEELAGERVAHWGVDGCLAPTPAFSLAGVARAIGAVTGAGSPVLDAVRADPWAVDGPGRTDTVIIERTGFFAKSGADGVFVATVPGAATVAVKIADGANRAAAPVALELLRRAGLLDDAAAGELQRLVADANLRVTL